MSHETERSPVAYEPGVEITGKLVGLRSRVEEFNKQKALADQDESELQDLAVRTREILAGPDKTPASRLPFSTGTSGPRGRDDYTYEHENYARYGSSEGARRHGLLPYGLNEAPHYAGRGHNAKLAVKASEAVEAAGTLAAWAINRDTSVSTEENTLWQIMLQERSPASLDPQSYVARAMQLVEEFQEKVVGQEVLWVGSNEYTVGADELPERFVAIGRVAGLQYDPGEMTKTGNRKERLKVPNVVERAQVSMHITDATKIPVETFRERSGSHRARHDHKEWRSTGRPIDQLMRPEGQTEMTLPIIDMMGIEANLEDSFSHMQDIIVAVSGMDQHKQINAVHNQFVSATEAHTLLDIERVFSDEVVFRDAIALLLKHSGHQPDLVLSEDTRKSVLTDIIDLLDYNATNLLRMANGSSELERDASLTYIDATPDQLQLAAGLCGITRDDLYEQAMQEYSRPGENALTAPMQDKIRAERANYINTQLDTIFG